MACTSLHRGCGAVACLSYRTLRKHCCCRTPLSCTWQRQLHRCHAAATPRSGRGYTAAASRDAFGHDEVYSICIQILKLIAACQATCFCEFAHSRLPYLVAACPPFSASERSRNPWTPNSGSESAGEHQQRSACRHGFADGRWLVSTDVESQVAIAQKGRACHSAARETAGRSGTEARAR